MWLESLSRGNSWCSRNRRGKYLESFTSSEKYKLHTSQHLILMNMCEKICHCFWSLRRESVGCFWCWGGIQKSLLMVRSDVEIENENLPFLYKLVGTWAFSPHPKYDQINKIDDFKERLFPHDMVLFSKKYFEEKKDWRSSLYLFQDIISLNVIFLCPLQERTTLPSKFFSWIAFWSRIRISFIFQHILRVMLLSNFQFHLSLNTTINLFLCTLN